MSALLDPTATASQVAPPAPEVLPERRPRARPVVIGAGRRPSAESVRLPAGLSGRVEVARAGAGPGSPAAGTARRQSVRAEMGRASLTEVSAIDRTSDVVADTSCVTCTSWVPPDQLPSPMTGMPRLGHLPGMPHADHHVQGCCRCAAPIVNDRSHRNPAFPPWTDGPDPLMMVQVSWTR